ncbi:uncharacterized protein A1O9_04223 [Exophiala aquamarina CBS 119918]|uniref:GRF-type domain-containing protein n=1 Tax=Exophiala aquamarina CBS 119918 TaxID=1182545 RepID=A0A072PGZ3_9EURO|nr:uncharacterized protein A1O9_04223 [Exophiala aquamarina CBS 119918]KEF59379.1 hypothetical protein A1O9_04223 [Exophiala aquamarina CBS 119918]
MPTDYSQVLAKGGYLKDGQWFCQCDLPPRLLTSKQGGSSGKRFLRCQQAGNDQCKFFLWEEEEATVREQANASYLRLPAPRTPTKLNTTNREPVFNGFNSKQSIAATPASGHSAAKLKTSPRYSPTPRSEGKTSPPVSSEDLSPTPHRVRVDHESDKDKDFTTAILKLLRSSNVVVGASTEVRLRLMIRSEIGAYQTKLQTCEEMITDLCQELDGLGF